MSQLSDGQQARDVAAFVESLAAQPPERQTHLVRARLQGGVPVEDANLWTRAAWVASQDALGALGRGEPEAALYLAEVHGLIADALGAISDQSWTDAMRIRALMITRMGVRSGHPVLDLGRITEWFRAATPVTLEQARVAVETGTWTPSGTVPGQLRDLRRLKGRVRVLRVLAEWDPTSLPSDLLPWLDLEQRLP